MSPVIADGSDSAAEADHLIPLMESPHCGEQRGLDSVPACSEADAEGGKISLGDPPADNTGVPADTAPGADAADLDYRPDERVAIDDANEAFGPVIAADIEAVGRLEDVEVWAPRLVRGVRAIRDRAMRETGNLNRFGSPYQHRFSDLLNHE
jgi:hypothetical protein